LQFRCVSKSFWSRETFDYKRELELKPTAVLQLRRFTLRPPRPGGAGRAHALLRAPAHSSVGPVGGGVGKTQARAVVRAPWGETAGAGSVSPLWADTAVGCGLPGGQQPPVAEGHSTRARPQRADNMLTSARRVGTAAACGRGHSPRVPTPDHGGALGRPTPRDARLTRSPVRRRVLSPPRAHCARGARLPQRLLAGRARPWAHVARLARARGDVGAGRDCAGTPGQGRWRPWRRSLVAMARLEDGVGALDAHRLLDTRSKASGRSITVDICKSPDDTAEQPLVRPFIETEIVPGGTDAAQHPSCPCTSSANGPALLLHVQITA
jgi:hypothetical protein